jgi:AcrR family transcriptional regulator
MQKRKKRLAAPERRRQIVEAASKLFSRKGFKGTTTREIAAAARISEATIFKHFSRKEDLYRAIIDRCCNDDEGSMLLMKSVEGKKGRALFKSLASFMMERVSSDPSFSRLLMYSALEGHKFSDIFIKSRGIETVGFLTEKIRELIEAGVFKKRDPELAARAFLGMVYHYCMVQEVYGLKRFFKCPPEAAAGTFVDIFIDGMQKEPGR